MNALVISLGGLNVSQLGCYGCEWIDTPNLNRFAADAFVFDQCFVDCPQPAIARRAWWSGCRQWQATSEQDLVDPAADSLIGLLRSRGVRVALIRDTAELLGGTIDERSQFDAVVEVQHDPDAGAAAAFAAARAWLKRDAGRGPFLLFLDCHGAHLPWPLADAADDADTEIDGDDEGDDDAEPGSTRAGEPAAGEMDEEAEFDPVRSTFAAVVSVLDEQFGEFMEFVRGHVADELLVLVTSDVGTDVANPATPPGLGEAFVHVPLLVRFSGPSATTGRSRALVQSLDLLPTVFDAMQLHAPTPLDGHSVLPIIRSQSHRVRDHVEIGLGGDWSIRTADWCLVQTCDSDAGGAAPVLRLYEKPADRWERNDVSKSHSERVEVLRAIRSGRLQASRAAIAPGTPDAPGSDKSRG